MFTDAAVRQYKVGVGYGMVIVNEDDTLQSALHMFENRSLSPLAVEVQAILQAVMLLMRMHIAEVVLHSDSLSALRMINGEQEPNSEVHFWILQIKELSKTFTSLIYVHVGRSSNGRADALAKYALQSTQSMLWLSNFPIWLVSMGPNVHCKCINVCSCNS